MEFGGTLLYPTSHLIFLFILRLNLVKNFINNFISGMIPLPV